MKGLALQDMIYRLQFLLHDSKSHGYDVSGTVYKSLPM